jgi:hypothetical protein
MHPEITRQLATQRVQDMHAEATVARRARQARRARRAGGLLAGHGPQPCPELVLRHA